MASKRSDQRIAFLFTAFLIYAPLVLGGAFIFYGFIGFSLVNIILILTNYSVVNSILKQRNSGLRIKDLLNKEKSKDLTSKRDYSTKNMVNAIKSLKMKRDGFSINTIMVEPKIEKSSISICCTKTKSSGRFYCDCGKVVI